MDLFNLMHYYKNTDEALPTDKANLVRLMSRIAFSNVLKDIMHSSRVGRYTIADYALCVPSSIDGYLARKTEPTLSKVLSLEYQLNLAPGTIFRMMAEDLSTPEARASVIQPTGTVADAFFAKHKEWYIQWAKDYVAELDGSETVK